MTRPVSGRIRSIISCSFRPDAAILQIMLGRRGCGKLPDPGTTELLKLAKETLTSQQTSYELIRSRYEAGMSSALVLHQAQTSVDFGAGGYRPFTTFVAQDENALTCGGRFPGTGRPSFRGFPMRSPQ